MFWRHFLKDQRGQDLVEYSLLMAFVCLASAATFISVGRNLANVWNASNQTLSTAYSVASKGS